MTQAEYILKLESALNGLIQAAESPAMVVDRNTKSLTPALAEARNVLGLPTGPPRIEIVSPANGN